jgi:phytoene dehydrogenase-like protein
LARLRTRTKVTSNEQLLTRRESSTLEILQSCGLSEQITERFFRPFLAGALLDPRLETSSRMLDFLLRMLGTGFAALPAGGIGSIPAQLAATLPGPALRIEARVEHLDGTAVVLRDDRIEARAVIVATEGVESARLLSGAVRSPEMRGVTCLYFAASAPPVEGPVLVLDGDRSGPVNTLCVVSEVAPSYAPPGTALVAASVPGGPEHGDSHLEEDVRAQLSSWFGSAVDDWRHLRTYRIPQALPAATPPALELADRAVRLGPGLYVCGDHRDTPSIQGALASGRRAAQAAVEELRR